MQGIHRFAALLLVLPLGSFGGAEEQSKDKVDFTREIRPLLATNCLLCHGPDAKGHDEIPRLAGQLYSYTIKALRNWSRERGQGGTREDTSAIMAPTAHNLTPAQITEVAAYVSTLN